MNALLLALAIFSGGISASPSVHLTNDSPTVGTIAAPVAVAQAKPVHVPAKIAVPAHKAVTQPLPIKPIATPAKPKTVTKPLAPSVVNDHITTLPECDEEDGTSTSGGVAVPSCQWTPALHGNGHGKPFISGIQPPNCSPKLGEAWAGYGTACVVPKLKG